MPVLGPQLDTIYKKGTLSAGVLVLHGFTGTPDCMRGLVNTLHQAGFTVLAPLLAGHGTTPEQCAETAWPDWYDSAQKGIQTLSQQCDKVFVAGLSLGGLLTLKLAQEHPHLQALACYASPLYLQAWVRQLLPIVRKTPLRWWWKYQKKMRVDVKDPKAALNFWNYDRMPLSCIQSLIELQTQVQKNLSAIKSPILLMHSRHDNTAPYNSMNQIASSVSSVITETVTLENSYHVLTIDYDKERVFQKTLEFFKRFL